MVLPLVIVEGDPAHLAHHEELHGRILTAGTGLTGGGNLTADRTFAADFGTAGGKVAQGNDSRITGAIQGTLVDAKGDLIGASADNTPVRVAVGTNGQLLLADSAQASGVRWATRTAPSYDPAMDGLIAVDGDPAIFRVNSGLGSAGWAARVLVPAGQPITGALTCVHAAGTLGAGGVNGFAVNDDAGTLVSSTVDDTSLWTSTGKRNKAFASPIAAATADRYVYVSLRVTGFSVDPGFAFTDGSSTAARLDGLMSTKKRSITLSGSVWANLDPVAGSSGGGYMPFLALY